MTIYNTCEGQRLLMIQQMRGHWNRWGPFLPERARGTVREDYSPDGEAWDISPTITLAREGIAGMKTASQGSASAINIIYVLP